MRHYRAVHDRPPADPKKRFRGVSGLFNRVVNTVSVEMKQGATTKTVDGATYRYDGTSMRRLDKPIGTKKQRRAQRRKAKEAMLTAAMEAVLAPTSDPVPDPSPADPPEPA